MIDEMLGWEKICVKVTVTDLPGCAYDISFQSGSREPERTNAALHPLYPNIGRFSPTHNRDSVHICISLCADDLALGERPTSEVDNCVKWFSKLPRYGPLLPS